MHALVVRVTIHNADRTREVLNSQVVPQVSGAPGFTTGYWTWSTGGGELNGLSMIIFDSEENARAAGDRVSAIAADAPDDVTLDGVEIREVVVVALAPALVRVRARDRSRAPSDDARAADRARGRRVHAARVCARQPR